MRPNGSADDDMEARRQRLRAGIAEHEAREAAERAKEEAQTRSMTGYAAAFRLGTEFVSAVVVGIALGWLLDWAAGTTPLFLVVFLLLGFAAGVLNVLRSAGLIQRPQVGKDRRDGPRPG